MPYLSTSGLRSRFLLFPLVLLLSLGCILQAEEEASADEEIPQGLLSESWDLLYVNSYRVGYIHQYRTREGDVIRTSVVRMMRLGRLGSESESKTVQVMEETLDGKPLGFTVEEQMGQDPMQVTGKLEDGVMKIEQKQYGVVTPLEVPWVEGALMDWGVMVATKDLEMAEGVSSELLVYTPSFSLISPMKTRIEVLKKENYVWRDETLELWKGLSQVIMEGQTIDTYFWTNEEGEMYASSTRMGSIVLETVRSDSAEALEDFVSAEMMMMSLLEVTGTKDLHEAREVTYKIQVRGEDLSIVDGLFVDDANQTVLSNEPEGTVVLRVHPHRQSESEQPVPGEEYLEASFFLNYKDEAVQALVQEIEDLQQLPVAERAAALTEWVYEWIEGKNFDTGFATASEVARQRQGDCTEHAVLLAALGRATGIPSRVAYGLATLVGEGEDTAWMGFHMWTQFYVDGKWRDYDAALFSLTDAPVRLSMGTSSLQKDLLLDVSLRIINVMGLLEVEVIEVGK